MARKTDIRLRRSNTANAIPTSGNLSDGELAMNTMDGALYFKKSDNTIITAHDNTIMHIDSTNDSIGIGTTSPSSVLNVHSSTDPKITISNGGGTSPSPELLFFRQSGVSAKINYNVANKNLILQNDYTT